MFFSKLYNLLSIGVLPTHNDREKRRIEAINLFNILCASVSACYALFFIYEDENYRSVPVLLSATFFFTIISVLQKKQYYNHAIVLLNINCGLIATVMSFLHGWWSGFPLSFLVTPLMIAVFQDLRQNWITVWVFLYYGAMLLFTYALHFFGLEYTNSNAEIMFPVNFLVILGLIFVLSFYLWRIYEDYSRQVEHTNNELLGRNEEMTQKNKSIEELVGMLHDKVKNNLQTLYLFSEMDRFAKIDVSTDMYMRLSRSRIKVMDICYQLEYEFNLPLNRWLKRFLTLYPPYLQSQHNDILQKNTLYTYDLKHTHLVFLPRKRFETMMLLFNELCNFLVQQAATPIGEVVHIYTAQDDSDSNQFVIGLSMQKYAQTPVFNTFFLRFVKEQQVELLTEFEGKTKFLKVELRFSL
jgi:hypothetical protein